MTQLTLLATAPDIGGKRGSPPIGRFRVLAVVPFEEEDESPFVGLLQVEAA